MAVLRRRVRPGPHPVSMKEKVTPGKFQEGKQLPQLCSCLEAGLSLTQGRVASACPQSGDFQRGSLPPAMSSRSSLNPSGTQSLFSGATVGVHTLGLHDSTAVIRAVGMTDLCPTLLRENVS